MKYFRNIFFMIICSTLLGCPAGKFIQYTLMQKAILKDGYYEIKSSERRLFRIRVGVFQQFTFERKNRLIASFKFDSIESKKIFENSEVSIKSNSLGALKREHVSDSSVLFIKDLNERQINLLKNDTINIIITNQNCTKEIKFLSMIK